MLASVARVLQANRAYGAGSAICDLGAGTGNFTERLAQAMGVPLGNVTCVEPQAEFGPLLTKHGLVQTPVGACEFCTQIIGTDQFDVVMLKEMCHLVKPDDRPAMWAGILKGLQPGGRVILIARPNKSNLPWFAAARAVYTRDTTPLAPYLAELKAAGFTNVTANVDGFRCRLAKAKWIRMLKLRFWSNLFGFSEDELAAGVAEVEATHAGVDTLEFDDTMGFVIAEKPMRRHKA